MKIYYGPLQVGDASYVEHVTINMVEITKDFEMTEFKSEK